MSILNELIKLEQSNQYPLHMPGHKRQEINPHFPYGLDITEIDGFDDLHHPEGILKDAQEKAAKAYGVPKAYYLVNGSTCGILAAVSAAVRPGARVLVARNCHKAVYHALALRRARVTYLCPEIDRNGICGPISPELVKAALEKDHFDAAIITSPTYEGITSDVGQIAKLLHENHAVLIVDEAHGAHFGFHGFFPENACKQGADAVIVSLHKTLPAPTQTALLLLPTDRLDAGRVEYFLDVYETSSPSYVLMAAMEEAIDFSMKNPEAWKSYADRLKHFYGENAGTDSIVFRTDDPGKIILLGRGIGAKLRERFDLEPEMESLEYTVVMTSLCDTEEGFRRLEEAVRLLQEEKCDKHEKGETREARVMNPSEVSMGEALEAEMEAVDFAEGINRRAGEFVYVYPPGIPLLVPGELISENRLKQLEAAKKGGLAIKGNAKENQIRVMKE